MARNGLHRIIQSVSSDKIVSGQGENILAYENRDGEPRVVTAYFTYKIPSPDHFGHDLRGLRLSLDISVGGCAPGPVDAGQSNILIDFARGTRISVPASTLIARCAYVPFPNSASPPFTDIVVDTWVGEGPQSSSTGTSATPRLSVFLTPNEDNVYPVIEIPMLARGVYAIANDATKQAGLAIQQLLGVSVGDGVLTETSAPFNDGNAIPIVQGALGLRVITAAEVKPNVVVVFNIAL